MLRHYKEKLKTVKLLIAGGGTGGHVFPALAIAREWMSRGADREVVMGGTQRGIEMKLVPAAGLPLETLRVAGLKGKGGATLASVGRLVVAEPGGGGTCSASQRTSP